MSTTLCFVYPDNIEGKRMGPGIEISQVCGGCEVAVVSTSLVKGEVGG